MIIIIGSIKIHSERSIIMCVTVCVYIYMHAYIEEVLDVGVARSDVSPVVLAAVPVLEVERRRVQEEEVRDSCLN